MLLWSKGQKVMSIIVVYINVKNTIFYFVYKIRDLLAYLEDVFELEKI